MVPLIALHDTALKSMVFNLFFFVTNSSFP